MPVLRAMHDRVREGRVMTEHQRLKEHLIAMLREHVTFTSGQVINSPTLIGVHATVANEIARVARELGFDGLADDPVGWARRTLAEIVQEIA